MRPRTLILGLTLGWAFACSGASTSTPSPKPDPTENVDPSKPQPAPNADKCKNVKGVSLPLEGGTIIECSNKKIVIDHGAEDPKSKRWEYAGAFKKKGFSQGDPVKNSPMVFKGSDSVVFEASAGRVVLMLRFEK